MYLAESHPHRSLAPNWPYSGSLGSHVFSTGPPGSLGLAHYRFLALVAGGDERASRLAERLALGKPAVSAAVGALVAQGL